MLGDEVGNLSPSPSLTIIFLLPRWLGTHSCSLMGTTLNRAAAALILHYYLTRLGRKELLDNWGVYVVVDQI